MTEPVLEISARRQFAWAVRRELWENRSIYLGPIAVGGLALAGFAASLATLPARVRGASGLGPAQLRDLIEQPYLFAALALMAVEMIVAGFYCLDALYGERRDRSILFWKSMPISDGTTVLAKAAIPIVVLPLVTVAVTAAVQGIMMIGTHAVLAASGIESPLPAAPARFFELGWINVVHLVVFHGFWYAPLFAWLLLVSAWALRVPFLWAVLPPVTVAIVERLAFDSTHFRDVMLSHFFGSGLGDSSPGMSSMTMDMLASHGVTELLFGAGLWSGLGVSAVCLFGAARLRRLRGAI